MRMSKSKLNKYPLCPVLATYKYKPRAKWYELSIIITVLVLSTTFLGYLITNHSAVQEGIARTVITGV